MGVSRQPLVSCVMPTRERRAFAAQAIWYSLRQEYPDKELPVLDDGDDRVEDLTRGDERFRYVHLAPATPVGAKRELGCELVRGSTPRRWPSWGPATRLELGAALAPSVPVAARPNGRLAELDGAVCLAEDLAEGLTRVLEDGGLKGVLARSAREFCEDHSWDQVPRRHVQLWAALEAR